MFTKESRLSESAQRCFHVLHVSSPAASRLMLFVRFLSVKTFFLTVFGSSVPPLHLLERGAPEAKPQRLGKTPPQHKPASKPTSKKPASLLLYSHRPFAERFFY